MGAIKDELIKIQYNFLEYVMAKDGAPHDEIEITSWNDFVDAFYEGDDAIAMKDAEDHNA
jgi:hypothetical protein